MSPEAIRRKVAGDPFAHYFGACPECGDIGDILHVGPDEFTVCHRCRVYDSIGSNLFSSWRHMTEAEFDANAATLALYNERRFVSPTAEDIEARTAYDRIMGHTQVNVIDDEGCPF